MEKETKLLKSLQDLIFVGDDKDKIVYGDELREAAKEWFDYLHEEGLNSIEDEKTFNQIVGMQNFIIRFFNLENGER